MYGHMGILLLVYINSLMLNVTTLLEGGNLDFNFQRHRVNGGRRRSDRAAARRPIARTMAWVAVGQTGDGTGFGAPCALCK